MSISVVRGRDIRPIVLDAIGVVDHFADEDFADVGAVNLVLTHWTDDEGVVITGTHPELVILFTKVCEALGVRPTADPLPVH